MIQAGVDEIRASIRVCSYQRIVPREACNFGGDGRRIYGVHVMREGVLDSQIVSPWNLKKDD